MGCVESTTVGIAVYELAQAALCAGLVERAFNERESDFLARDARLRFRGVRTAEEHSCSLGASESASAAPLCDGLCGLALIERDGVTASGQRVMAGFALGSAKAGPGKSQHAGRLESSAQR